MMKKIIKKILQARCNSRYQKELAKRKMDYGKWSELYRQFVATSKMEEKPGEEQKVKYRTGQGAQPALRMITLEKGNWDGRAERLARQYFAQNPEVLFAYVDEDVKILSQGHGEAHTYPYENPHYKPDWSPDTYLCGKDSARDYLGGALIVREEIYPEIAGYIGNPMELKAQLVRIAGGLSRGCKKIGHISQVLFHRDTDWNLSGKTEDEKYEKEKQPAPLVSVIIPSKDNFSMLKRCVTSVKSTTHTPLEFILVDNGSTEETRREIEAWARAERNIQYVYEPAAFNFSRMCNRGESLAKGSLLLFLNDDVEAVKNGWLSAMVKKAVCDHVGCVGMKLLYPDGSTIQHAGITNIGMGPVHKLQFLKDDKTYYDNRNRGVRNVLAVTAACLMVRKEVFEEVGGFCEELQVAFNDVDMNFSIYERGYHNVVILDSYLLHHESASRGSDESAEKWQRLMWEKSVLYQRHPALSGKDPYYNPGLNVNGLDTRIIPAYEQGIWLHDKQSARKIFGVEDAREDACLLVRIEHVDDTVVQGYAVVLGSDNACFEKSLVFRNDESCYMMDFTPQYRSDLAENMPDQKNVALCGFRVNFEGRLSPGTYQIGALAKDQLSKLKLVNFTSRSVTF